MKGELSFSDEMKIKEIYLTMTEKEKQEIRNHVISIRNAFRCNSIIQIPTVIENDIIKDRMNRK